MFDNMTPQQAAEAIVNEIERDDPMDAVAAEEARQAIAEACQHFYERGKRDAYKHAAEMALANDDFDDYYQWIEEQYR